MSARRILGVILAGGLSRRFGSDKAEAVIGGKTLLERVIARAAPQVEYLALSARAPRAVGLPTVVDIAPDGGPLAGVLSALGWARTRGFEVVATFPCDSPFFPLDLVGKFEGELVDGVDCVMAQRGQIRHCAFALWRSVCEESLAPAFRSGLRRLSDVETVLNCTVAEFPVNGDGPGGDPFFNLNRQADVPAAEAWLRKLSSTSDS
jgi:molybdopterin-guanine dinucleotide biosynthesis protein A